jgi:hypothetical protein
MFQRETSGSSQASFQPRKALSTLLVPRASFSRRSPRGRTRRAPSAMLFTESSSTNTCGASRTSDHPHRRPLPAKTSAIEAPSECPKRTARGSPRASSSAGSSRSPPRACSERPGQRTGSLRRSRAGCRRARRSPSRGDARGEVAPEAERCRGPRGGTRSSARLRGRTVPATGESDALRRRVYESSAQLEALDLAGRRLRQLRRRRRSSAGTCRARASSFTNALSSIGERVARRPASARRRPSA